MVDIFILLLFFYYYLSLLSEVFSQPNISVMKASRIWYCHQGWIGKPSELGHGNKVSLLAWDIFSPQTFWTTPFDGRQGEGSLVVRPYSFSIKMMTGPSKRFNATSRCGPARALSRFSLGSHGITAVLRDIRFKYQNPRLKTETNSTF